MDELISTDYPEYLIMYRSFPSNVQGWNTIHYMILHRYGEVYADLDTECFRPIDYLLENEDMCFGQEPVEHNVYPGIALLVGNAFMASCRGNEGMCNIPRRG